MPLIAILDNLHGFYKEEEAIFHQREFKLIQCSSDKTHEILKAAGQAEALLVNLPSIHKALLTNMPHLKVISRYGVGYDNVDIETATNLGIWVAHCPAYCSEEVAEHTLALLLSLTRETNRRWQAIESGRWGNQPDSNMKNISQMKIGILGFGRSGRAFAGKLGGLNPQALYVCDPELDHGFIRSFKASKVDFETLLTKADVLSLHLPLNHETRYILNEKTLGKMKNTALVINTSRGALIREEDLIKALENGQIGGAGLDVFEKEPLAPDHPFLKLPNVSVTDHSAWYSPKSFSTLKRTTAENALNVLRGKPPLFAVNQPLFLRR